MGISMAMVHNIDLIVKKHTLGSMIKAAGTGMEFRLGHQEKLIMDSSNKVNTMDMESTCTLMVTSMMEIGKKANDQEREYLLKLLPVKLREENGKMANLSKKSKSDRNIVLLFNQ